VELDDDEGGVALVDDDVDVDAEVADSAVSACRCLLAINRCSSLSSHSRCSSSLIPSLFRFFDVDVIPFVLSSADVDDCFLLLLLLLLLLLFELLTLGLMGPFDPLSFSLPRTTFA